MINFKRLNRILVDVKNEYVRASGLFSKFHSGHEGKAIIEEDLDELWDEVKKFPLSNPHFLRKEAIQIAAMAVRFIMDICLEEEENVSIN